MYTRVECLYIIMFTAVAAFCCGANASALDDVRAGSAAVSKGDYDEGIRLLTLAIESRELSIADRADAYTNRGIAWSDKKDYDHAIADFSDAIRINAQDAGALYNRGNAWYNKKDYDRAIADYDEAIRINPQKASVYYDRGNAWYSKKDYDHAIADYGEAIRIDAQDGSAFYNRGNAWSEKKDYDRAIADYGEAIRINPQKASAFYNRGNAWSEKKDYDRAIADYGEALRINPLYDGAFTNRAIAWSDKRDYNRAIIDFSEAIRINPQDASAFSGRGCAEFYQAKFSSAASDLAQSQRLNANAYTALWLYLARSRVAGGDGKAELTLNTSGLDQSKWPAPVVALYLDKAAPSTVTSQAADPDAETDKAQRCEATFYLGEWHLMRGEAPQARTLFTQAQNSCPVAFIECKGAIAELERLN
jgi:tetratricopeptide (TPR) repeat protein